ncbi:MAG: ferredoxin--NADP+ reductase [Pseudomonadales bacterium]|jgi:ferredoxin--NADP+ reductase
MPVVTVDGFSEDGNIDFLHAEAITSTDSSIAIDLQIDANLGSISKHFGRIHTLRITFPSLADGRGFSLAQRIRYLGYKGRIRAKGPIISDQFRYALACGFDEVEIDQATASRQPVEHWLDPEELSYRNKLENSPKPLFLQDNVYREQVIDVQHYTDGLFRFRVKRPDSFRFTAGEFVMLGMEIDDAVIYRAYSICSASYDEYLEFYSVKIPNGDLTRRLKWIRPGDSLLLKKKTTGSLVPAAVLPGRRLFLHSTGTGIAPFISLIQEPTLYEQFESIVLTHTCRFKQELVYGRERVESVLTTSLVQSEASRQLLYDGSTTREANDNNNRITDKIRSTALYQKLDIEPFNSDTDRVLVCGSKSFNTDMKEIFLSLGATHGSLNKPGTFLWERAFAE